MPSQPKMSVFFRDEYFARGEGAVEYFLVDEDDTHGCIYPANLRLRRYPDAPMGALTPPISQRVPLELLRWIDNSTHQAFLDAVRNGKPRKAAQLLKSDPLVDPNGNREYLSLMVAGETSNIEQYRKIVDVLIKSGADIHRTTHSKNREGWTALADAIHDENMGVAGELVKRGARIDHQIPNDTAAPWDLMELAASSGAFDAIGWLMHQGFSPKPWRYYESIFKERKDIVDPATYQISFASGAMALPLPHLAAISIYSNTTNAQAVFDYLAQVGLNLMEKDGNSLTPIEVAARVGSLHAQQALGRILTGQEAKIIDSDTPSVGAMGRRGRL